MHGSALYTQFRNAAAIAGLAFALSGCLTSEEDAKSDEEVVAENQISGSVGDGPIVGASVRVLRNDGEPIVGSESDASADYGLAVNVQSMYYPLTIEARGGIDLVTNTAPDFVLISAVPEQSDQTYANINPFSTIAVETARDLPGGITKENLATGEAYVTSVLSFGLDSLLASGPMGTRITANNIAEIVRASEALAETVRRTRNLQIAFGYPSSGDTVIRAIASDLVDGVVDGQGGARVDPRVSALSTVVAVQVLLESMQFELRVNGQDASAAMNSAISQVADSTPRALIGSLNVTPGMLEAARVGLDALLTVDNNPKLQALRTALDSVRGGMDPNFVRTLVPDDYRQTLDNVLMATASSGDAVMATINEVAGGFVDQPAANRAPNISGAPPTLVVAGSSYLFVPDASDPDGDALTFSISGKPAWASFDSASGSLSGTPSAGNAGSYGNVVISASDGELVTTMSAFAITVAMTNSPPTITGAPSTLAQVGSTYSFAPAASDPDGDTLTFSITGRPLWASFNSTNGRLSGTPGLGDVGDYTGIVISVSDGAATDRLAAFTITVPVSNAAPSISGTPPAQVNVNNNYSFTPTASDANGDSLSFSALGLPAWASFDNATGRLSGTPTAADVGVYTGIRITVSDGSATSSLATFSITVNSVSLGAVTLDWMPPTQNEDGSALVDLAGYKIYWGSSPGNYPNSVTINNPGLSSYVVDNLVPGTYEFVATSFNAAGVESSYSNPATKVVN